MSFKKIPSLYRYGGLRKSDLCQLIGIANGTLIKWVNHLDLPIDTWKSASRQTRKNQPLSIEEVTIILFVWVGVYLMNWGYDLYREQVIEAGLSLRFDKSFAQRTGGGDLKMALSQIIASRSIHVQQKKPLSDGQIQALQYLIEYLKEKEETTHETPQTSGIGDETRTEYQGSGNNLHPFGITH